MHDIGKNLVAMMLEGAGFKVVDLGVNVSPAKFMDALTQEPAPPSSVFPPSSPPRWST
jgi:5-methyltetrahydrofolate--homocysteine methyltransferase